MWYYGIKSIPPHMQYWTLCGNHVEGSQPIAGSELLQMAKVGLLSQEQFVGVDDDEDIIAKNETVFTCSTWICGEFIQVLHTTADFNPAIIHLDTISMPDKAIELLHGVISRVEYCGHSVMVTTNMITKRWMDATENNPKLVLEQLLQRGFTSRWQICNMIYKYSGVLRSSRTRMSAFVMFYIP